MRLPELFFTEYPVNGDDHCYHEFWSVTATEDSSDDVHARTIEEFAEEFASAGKNWRAFAR